MNLVLFFIIVSYYYGGIHGVNYMVNEGASTSNGRTSEQELNSCIRCDLQNRASNLVLLMTAEDTRGENLTNMMDNHFSELEAFYTEVSYVILSVEFQGTDVTAEESSRRLNFFTEMIDQKILELFQKACTEHYYYHSLCEYNPRSSRVFVREIIDLNKEACLCENSWGEQPILNAPFQVPVTKKPEKKFTLLFFKDENRLIAEEISIHYIIPIELITRFIGTWLSNDLDSYPNNSFNGCVHKLFTRLKRSMQKLLLVSINKSGLFSIRSEPLSSDNFSFNPDDTLLLESLKKAISWLCGNIFIGPTNRGPFDPTFEKTGDELLEAFDYSAESIVGQRRFQFLLESFYRMLDYVHQAPRMNPFWRLVSGFNIFTVMALSFQTDTVGITEMDSENWVEVKVTEEVLRRIKSENAKREMLLKKYWDIKPNPRRFQRSTGDDYYFYKTDQEVSVGEVDLKSQWRNFVTALMKISMEALSKDQSLTWSCNFTQLYSHYLSRELTSKNKDCSNCLSFDEFLYSKISDSKDWHNCNQNQTQASISKWCLAWKNVMSNLKTKTTNFANSFNFKQNNRPVAQNFLNMLYPKLNIKDTEILVNWLSSRIKMKTNEKSEHFLAELLKNFFHETESFGYIIDKSQRTAKLYLNCVRLLNIKEK